MKCYAVCLCLNKSDSSVTGDVCSHHLEQSDVYDWQAVVRCSQYLWDVYTWIKRGKCVCVCLSFCVATGNVQDNGYILVLDLGYILQDSGSFPLNSGSRTVLPNLVYPFFTYSAIPKLAYSCFRIHPSWSTASLMTSLIPCVWSVLLWHI